MQIINVFDRHIDISEQNKMISVCQNALSEAICFSLNRYTSNGIDLSKLSCFIKTLNSDNTADLIIPEVTASDDKIQVKWIISSATTVKEGEISVQLLFQASENDTATVWQTDIARFEIIGTLKNADEIAEIYPTMFQQWDSKMNGALSDIADMTAESEANKQATFDARNAAELASLTAQAKLSQIQNLLDNYKTSYSPSMTSGVKGKLVETKLNSDLPFKSFNLNAKSNVTISDPALPVSPDNPAIITGISGDIGFNLTGENLCYFDKSLTNINGLEIKFNNETGEVTLNGTTTISGTYEFNSSNTRIFIPEGCSGSFKFYETNSEKPTDLSMGIRCLDKSFLFSYNLAKDKASYQTKFTSKVNNIINGFSIWISNGVTFDNYTFKACLSLDQITDYPVSHLENHKISIPDDVELLSVNNSYDCIDIINSKLIKNIQTYNLSANEDFIMQELDSEHCCFHFPISNAINGEVISNMFSSNTSESEFIKIDQNRCYIKIKKIRLAQISVDGFKTWLSNNPVKIYYKLTEPIISNISTPSLVNNKNIAVITANSNSGVEFDVEYIKDTQAVIDQLVAAIISLGGNVNV